MIELVITLTEVEVENMAGVQLKMEQRGENITLLEAVSMASVAGIFKDALHKQQMDNFAVIPQGSVETIKKN